MTSFAEYQQIDAVNVSSLLWLDRSPRHYQHALRGAKDTAALSFGRITHMAVLEPERYHEAVAVWPRDGGRRYGKVWDQFQEENASKEIVTEAEHLTAIGIAGAVMSHPVAGPYILGAGKTEHTIQWSTDGIGCKGRLDKAMADGKTIIDLKTAVDATDVRFGYSAARYHYHTRAAWYVDGWRAATGHDAEFVLIAVEKEPPFAVAVYRVGEDAILAGRDHYRRLLDKLKRCRESDTWPGIGDDQMADLVLPQWCYGAVDAGLIFEGDV